MFDEDDRTMTYDSFHGCPLADISKAAAGAVVLSVDTSGNDAVVVTDRGTLRFFHEQDCCESVRLEDGSDELPGIVGKTIVMVEELSNEGTPAPVDEYGTPESYTWTFYRIVTSGPDVTLRWLGESNGYYSERVDVSWTAAGAPK